MNLYTCLIVNFFQNGPSTVKERRKNGERGRAYMGLFPRESVRFLLYTNIKIAFTF
jgi:hypothetical protein